MSAQTIEISDDIKEWLIEKQPKSGKSLEELILRFGQLAEGFYNSVLSEEDILTQAKLALTDEMSGPPFYWGVPIAISDVRDNNGRIASEALKAGQVDSIGRPLDMREFTASGKPNSRRGMPVTPWLRRKIYVTGRELGERSIEVYVINMDRDKTSLVPEGFKPVEFRAGFNKSKVDSMLFLNSLPERKNKEGIVTREGTVFKEVEWIPDIAELATKENKEPMEYVLDNINPDLTYEIDDLWDWVAENSLRPYYERNDTLVITSGWVRTISTFQKEGENGLSHVIHARRTADEESEEMTVWVPSYLEDQITFGKFSKVWYLGRPRISISSEGTGEDEVVTEELHFDAFGIYPIIATDPSLGASADVDEDSDYGEFSYEEPIPTVE